MFNITHIDKFFHNSPGAEMYLGTPHFKVDNNKGQCRQTLPSRLLFVIFLCIIPFPND